MKSKRFANTLRSSKSSVFDRLKTSIPRHGQVLFVLPRSEPLLLCSSFALGFVGDGADREEGEFENTFPPTLVHYYVAFRAYDRFLQRHGRAPGRVDSTYDTDLAEMTRLSNEILGESPKQPEMVDNACAEM